MRRWLSAKAKALKTDTKALYLASRDPRTPWYAKALVVVVVAYALSPVDLIPDFIPVLGYLDDLILLPLGIALAIKLVPDRVMTDARNRARHDPARPVNWIAGVLVIAIWLASALAVAWIAYRWWQGPG